MLYHQTLLGAYNTIGQSETWYSTSSLAKRSRFETASIMPIYPQRPGEKDCAHYMLTRTCKFGDSCKFDHPIWVPQGGIPDWKEVTICYYIYSYGSYLLEDTHKHYYIPLFHHKLYYSDKYWFVCERIALYHLKF